LVGFVIRLSGKIMRRYLKAREPGTDAGDLSTLDG
jgi:hypothetical protein